MKFSKLLFISLCLLFLCGCNKEPKVRVEMGPSLEIKSDKGENIPETEVIDNNQKLKIVNENSKSRPYAIMINNISVARPLQSGLQDAYIIYEIIVEGGITRYMALYMDQNTARIGTVRSASH